MKIINKFNLFRYILFLIVSLQLPIVVFAQDKKESNFDRDSLLLSARKMIETARYCSLITLDSLGQPDARIMDPFLPNEDFVVWFGTNIQSRKVKEIENDSRITLYYQASNNAGYVLIKGQGYIINDPSMKLKYWKNEWSRFYQNNKSNYTLIKVVPEKLEIIDYQHGIFGESETWAVPYVEFKSGK